MSDFIDDTVDLFGGLVVICWDSESEKLTQYVHHAHQKATYTVGWLDCFHGYHYRFLLSSLLQSRQREVYENVSESDFWCRGFKRKQPDGFTITASKQRPKSKVLCGNHAVVESDWEYDGRYDVTEPLIKISKITLRSTVWLSAASDVTLFWRKPFKMHQPSRAKRTPIRNVPL